MSKVTNSTQEPLNN